MLPPLLFLLILFTLPNPLILPTPTSAPILTLRTLHHLADPPTHTLAFLLATEHRLSILNFNIRRLQRHIRHRLATFTSKSERAHRRSVAKERLGFGKGFWGWGDRGGVAEDGVHVFQAHVGGFGVDEVDCKALA